MRKTVPQVTTKLELSMTLVKHALAEPLVLHGISINANRGPTAQPASTFLPTERVPRIVFVAIAEPEHIPLTQIHSLVPRGPVV